MTSEAQLWNRVREALRGVRGLHLVRIENAVEIGTPDVNYCLLPEGGAHLGECGWIELKCPDVPRRATTKFELGLNKDQVRWRMQRFSVGGRVATLAQVGRRYFWAPGVGAFGSQTMWGWEECAEQGELRIYPKLESDWLIAEMTR